MGYGKNIIPKMFSVYISTSSFGLYSDKAFELLKEKNINYTLNPYGKKLNSNQIVELISSYDAVIAGTENYDIKILDCLRNLKVISRVGIGMDNIDIVEAKRKGIKIYKTSTSPGPAVAELVLGLMIDLSRKISFQNNDMRTGNWRKQMGNLLYGKTLGVIGLGSIGKTFIRLTRGFNFQILAFDLYHDKNFAVENNVKFCDYDTLISNSDIITVHLNLTDKTNQLLNSSSISKMKSECILINTSRGEIIDEDALFKALQEKKILGAGLDVYQNEPYKGPLTKLENVILTPHIGSYAKELRVQMEIEAVNNLIKGINEV